MDLDSTPGQGTRVDLWLRMAADGPAPRPRRLGASLAAAAARRGVVLLVDDEDFVRMSAADMLGDLGYSVIEAATAEQALHLIDGGARPEVLVTDNLMPGMSGVDLVRAVQRRHPGLPVLIVSGYAEGEGIPADLPHLTKPFRLAELATVLKAVMIAAGRG